MLSDLRYAFHQLTKFPGYTTTVVLTLAFGIAVNTQIFSIISALFLQPMPVRDPGKLTAIVQRSDVINLPYQISFLDFQDIRSGSKALTDHIAYVSSPAHVSVPGETPERVWVEAVTPDAFAKLGVTVILGRALQPSDGERPPATPVAVITHRYWKNKLGGDPAVIGRSVLINGKPFTVVGIAKPGFESFSYMISVGAFVPSGAASLIRTDGDNVFKYRGMCIWRVLSYLQPGATIAEANAELGVFAQRFAKDFPEDHRNVRFQAVLEQHARPDPALTDFTPVFAALFTGLVALVLFIACANVANLMSAHALNREKELVVRAALGATRWQIIRQLLIESALLALIAGVVGYTLAAWGGTLLQQFAPTGEFPMREFKGSNWQVLVFTGSISLIAGLASGLFPALRSSRIHLNEGLKQGTGRQVGSQSHWMRNMLVIGQVAISCVVLVASALFLRGLNTLRDLNLGFRPERIIMLSLDLNLQGYNKDRGLRFQKQVLERVHALPGVESASFTQHVPFNNNNMVIRYVWPDNPTAHLPNGQTSVASSAVTPGFAKMFGLQLIRGRDLAPTDDEKSPHVAVINEAMAKAFWPGIDPVGQHFHRIWSGSPPIEVVGVVATGKYIMLTEDPKPYCYIPFAQDYGMPASLVVRTSTDPRSIAQSLRDSVQAIDPDLPIYNLTTLNEHIATSTFALMPLRMGATMAAIQGGLGLLLAVLGLYSVVSYGVTRRTREIGVRMALGATNDQILKLVSREGLRLTFIGLAFGLLLAGILSFGLSRILFGVRPVDPVAFPAVILLLVATAAIACWLPARRATKINPIEALRAD